MKQTRTRMIIVICMASAALLASLGCSTDTGTGGLSGSGGGTTPATYTTGMVAAECERVFTCCTAADMTTKYSGRTPPADEAACRSDQATLAQIGGLVLQASTSKNRMSFNGTKAAACIAAIGAMPCADFKGRSANGFSFTEKLKVAECDGITAPLVEIGGACTSGLGGECKAGYCRSVGGDADGTCTAIPKEGEACDGTCEADMTCSVSKCTATTTDKDVGEACSSSFDCKSEVCSGDKCVEKGDKGANCVFGKECKSANCDNVTTVGKCIDARKEGDACSGDSECLEMDCTDKKCAKTPEICVGK